MSNVDPLVIRLHAEAAEELLSMVSASDEVAEAETEILRELDLIGEFPECFGWDD